MDAKLRESYAAKDSVWGAFTFPLQMLLNLTVEFEEQCALHYRHTGVKPHHDTFHGVYEIKYPEEQ